MKFIFFSLISFLMIQCPSKNIERSFEKHIFYSDDGQELPYRVLFPDNYSKNKNYPLVLFLHGSGERGRDNEAQLQHIASSFMTDEYQAKYPSIIIFPQCPLEDYWAPVDVVNGKWTISEKPNPQPAMRALIELVDQFIIDFPVDRSRMYLAGLSMGGFGTLDLLSRRPNMFAAAIPICGGGNKRFTYKYEQTPIWMFHGAKDPVVPVSLSQEMVDEFRIRNMDYKYTEYPEGGHDVWNKAWSEPELLPWLFSKNRITEQ